MNKKLVAIFAISTATVANSGFAMEDAHNLDLNAGKNLENDYIKVVLTQTIDNKHIDLKKVTLKRNPEKRTVINLIIPGMIDNRKVIIEEKAFSDLSFDKLYLNIEFVEEKGNKAILPHDSSSLFKSSKSIQSIDLSKVDTSWIRDTSSMFEGCVNLTSLNLKDFSTEKVCDMSYMFSDCQSLLALNLDKFKTSKVRNMNGMFYNCKSLSALDLKNFNLKNVSELDNMFSGCHSLSQINLIGAREIDYEIECVKSMFANCENLSSIPDLDHLKIDSICEGCINVSNPNERCDDDSYYKDESSEENYPTYEERIQNAYGDDYEPQRAYDESSDEE